MNGVPSTPAVTSRRPWSTAAGWVKAHDPGLLAVKRSYGPRWSCRSCSASPTCSSQIPRPVCSPPSVRSPCCSWSISPGGPAPGWCPTSACSWSVASSSPSARRLDPQGGGSGGHGGGRDSACSSPASSSPQAATASTAALLVFVLPVAVAQPARPSVPDCSAGWSPAVFCVPACMLIWPTPWHDDLRRRLSATVGAVGRLAGGPRRRQARSDALATVDTERDPTAAAVSGTPYPPTGAAASAMALAKLVGRVEWVAGNCRIASDQATTLASAHGPNGLRGGGRDPAAECVASSATATPSGGRPGAGRSGAGVDPTTRPVDHRGTRCRGVHADRPGLAPCARSGDGADSTRRAPRYRLLAGPELPCPGSGHGHRDGGRRRAGGGRRRGAGDRTSRGAGAHLMSRVEPARLPPLLPLGVVPKRRPRCGRAGPGGGGRRGHRCRARILGGAGHAVGAPVQRTGHRGHGPAGRRRDGRRVRGRLGHHDRRRRPHASCCGRSSRWPSWCRAWLRR